MNKIFTVGFTKKTAEEFFTLLEENSVAEIIDVRLNNTSQLAGFSKFPDIKFFLQRISNINYRHEKIFAPTENILSDYKKKIIDWAGYEKNFENLMRERNISDYILKNYFDADKICLLCSEPTPENCHRRLVAEKFAEVFANIKIIHL